MQAETCLQVPDNSLSDIWITVRMQRMSDVVRQVFIFIYFLFKLIYIAP